MYQTYIMYTHPYPLYTKVCTFLYHYQGLYTVYRVEKINMHPRLYLEQTIFLEKIVITLGRFDSQRQGIVISCLLLSAKSLFKVFTNHFIMVFLFLKQSFKCFLKSFAAFLLKLKKGKGRNFKKNIFLFYHSYNRLPLGIIQTT